MQILANNSKTILQFSMKWPGLCMAARQEVTLFWYRTHCLCCANEVVVMLTRCIYMTKAERSVSKQDPASLPFKGQVTEQTTVKWSIAWPTHWWCGRTYRYSQYVVWCDLVTKMILTILHFMDQILEIHTSCADYTSIAIHRIYLQLVLNFRLTSVNTKVKGGVLKLFFAVLNLPELQI